MKKYKVIVALIKFEKVEVSEDEIKVRSEGLGFALFERAKEKILDNNFGLYDRVDIEHWMTIEDDDE